MSVASSGSGHDRYRKRLASLETDRVPVEAIAEAGRVSGASAAERRWIRDYGRFFPGREPYATLVFETEDEPQLLCHVDVFASQPAFVNGGAALVERAEGWFKVTPFPDDEALPTLRAVLERIGPRTVVRYRPRSRCTIRFESPAGRVCFAKVFRDDSGQHIHVNSQRLWQAALRNELEFEVARPGAYDAETRTLWQEAVPGVPLTARHLEAEGASLAHRMGRASASLTRSRVRPEKVYDWDAHLGRTLVNVDDLKQRIPRLAGALDTLLGELRRAHASVGERLPRPIHGSLSRTQWVGGASRLGLVDFDKLAFGDPEFDVAAFLTELDYDRMQVEQIRDAFITGYEAVAGPLDRRLLHLYAAQERLEKALKSARAVRPDGDVRAEHHLETALAECVEPSA